VRFNINRGVDLIKYVKISFLVSCDRILVTLKLSSIFLCGQYAFLKITCSGLLILVYLHLHYLLLD
jgi:hypothetical protein